MPLFLFAPVFSGPQDAGLHLFGPQDKIVDFNMFSLVFGEFNCTKEIIIKHGPTTKLFFYKKKKGWQRF